MARRTRPQSAPKVQTVAHCEGAEVKEFVELTSLVEVPLPGREAVTLSAGTDPRGVVPGFTEALRRRDRFLDTFIHSPAALRSYALDRVVLSAGEVEVDFLLFESVQPDELDVPVGRLVLRMQTESGSIAGKVVPTPRSGPASSRASRRAQAARQARRPEPQVTLAEQVVEPIPKVPAPVPTSPEPSWTARPVLVLGRNSRLAVWFSLFLATVLAWKIIQTNRDEIEQDRFNRAVAAHELALRQSTTAEGQLSETRVRLQGQPLITGELPMEPFEEALLSVVGVVSSCYGDVEGWQTLPSEGELTLDVSLSAQGRAATVAVSAGTLESEEVNTCTIEAFEAFEGPKPVAGTAASFQVTLGFTSGV